MNGRIAVLSQNKRFKSLRCGRGWPFKSRIQDKLWILLALTCIGCSGKLDYVRPTTASKLNNSITISAPRDAVWNATVPKLGKQFFVINNLDKSSGLINLSYSGDPENYVDCGRIISYVSNARGERTYDFPASKADQQYEVMSGNLFLFHRKMSLDGRINLIFEELSPSETRVTANTKYVLSRIITVNGVSGGIPQTNTDSISFISGGNAAFAAMSDGRATECIATGKLESEILQAIQ
ncbi:hypothetical protein [Methylomonas rapida]|uniref:Uncharacterized protein n=1 Tax=Methylomonas rapida TaxID=2963939 RepID=A0ABY7GJV4_9GAMM|nr:hypothetical protein [Methylomonas rapida]WAR44888.1 hypothetical protein NM686_021520 [Methylomonas rapida]